MLGAFMQARGTIIGFIRRQSATENPEWAPSAAFDAQALRKLARNADAQFDAELTSSKTMELLP
jgi:hypothetical protein